ncbi:hypothetical protein FSPOR_5188 [Fusarium sporotrichioides]|uniref:Xylanolytic transcriptional activator regulatory domain-containing protein n=1 Tax=Fusarium sporotrichioides TaxID=5514 RepID=A0A395S946_FUSSP|nr:hypothetical protein FSPOR_5188 [Fusarium sporotrichioides]
MSDAQDTEPALAPRAKASLKAVLENLVSEETRSQRSTASVESASPMSLHSSSTQMPRSNHLTGQHDSHPQRDENSSLLPPSDNTTDKQKHAQDKNNPIEGLSSFSAHSTLAIDLLHKVADAKFDDGDSNEIEELLASMREIVDAVKVRRHSAHSLFPLAAPNKTQRTPAELPPIQVVVTLIRKAQEFIIVNITLYFLFTDSAPALTKNKPRDEIHAEYRLLCQRNAETALSKLSFYFGASHNMILALVLGAIYAVEISRPCLAWTFICSAYQSAYSLGYHTCAHGSNQSSNTPNQFGLLFWVIYYLEKHFCLRLGRCSSIIDTEITIPLPGSSDTQRNPGMGYFRLIVRAGSLTSRIYQELYSTQSIGLSGDLRAQRVVNLSQEFCAIRDESRKNFKIWAQHRLDHNMHGADVIEYLAKLDEVFWWSTLTLINRAVPPQPDFAVNFADECVVAARAALESHQNITLSSELSGLRPLTSYINWLIVSSPFVPFIVMFCNVIEHENTNDLDTMQAFISSIESATHGSAAIARYHKLFQVFHDVARRFLQLKAVHTPSQQGHQELKAQMNHCLSALGLHQQDYMQNGYGDSPMFWPSMVLMQAHGSDSGVPVGMEQPVQMMNWYALDQQVFESFGND